MALREPNLSAHGKDSYDEIMARVKDLPRHNPNPNRILEPKPTPNRIPNPNSECAVTCSMLGCVSV